MRKQELPSAVCSEAYPTDPDFPQLKVASDRRLMLEVDNHLRALGWAIVRLDVFRTLGLPHRSAPR